MLAALVIKILGCLLILTVLICRIRSIDYKQELRRTGENCITRGSRPIYKEIFETDDGIVEHHKPRSYHYSTGSGTYCPDEDFKVPGLHGML